jgi:hypothetical protein
MTIPISEVIEMCAQLAEGWDSGAPIAKDIRALAAKYGGCIVAETPALRVIHGSIELYRAKEAK